MVAVPPLGDGPYGTNLSSARSSTIGAFTSPKLVAESNTVAQSANASQTSVAAATPRRPTWFKRQVSKLEVNLHGKSFSV
ncbi:hypothetical protein N7478_004406 [Penicillium angulare]|uniref:uncharacterized protein n=1 Tax=Penicillium angulare TaxID=116970 RepID=UPI002541F04A|nr:uncharacterized protein N7478_004406 [Penicillium angulare]KAJ5279034.1 hypothetical protein N7478_004406 [Penicillium angulare]